MFQFQSIGILVGIGRVQLGDGVGRSGSVRLSSRHALNTSSGGQSNGGQFKRSESASLTGRLLVAGARSGQVSVKGQTCQQNET